MRPWIRYAAAVVLGAGSFSAANAQYPPWQQPPPVPPVYNPAPPGWDQKAQIIADWYRHYLRREPDPTGLYGWAAKLDLAYPQRTLAQILGSDEYYRLAGNRDDLFIRTMFHDVLGQEPLPKDLRFWLRALDHSRNRARLALDFLNYTGGGSRY